VRAPAEEAVQEVRALPVGRQGCPLRGRQGRLRRRAGEEAAQEVRAGVGHAVPVLQEAREEAGQVRDLRGNLAPDLT